MLNIKTAVRELLLQAVEELVGAPRADRPLDLEVSSLSLGTHAWGRHYDHLSAELLVAADIREARETAELLAAHRKLAAAMLSDLRCRGNARLAAALTHPKLPTELRRWGRGQQAKFESLGRRPNGFTLAYLVLTLEASIAFEVAQSEGDRYDHDLDELHGITRGEYDGGDATFTWAHGPAHRRAC